jgi:hypothetical protein
MRNMHEYCAVFSSLDGAVKYCETADLVGPQIFKTGLNNPDIWEEIEEW